MHHRIPHTLAAVAMLLASSAQAGPLADPTRPPAALMAPGGLAAAALPHRANLDTARAIAAAARAAEPAPAPATPALVQGVQLPANGAASALVDGRPVKVGDALDGRTVLAIDAQGLLVKGARGPERLWLLNGAPKQAAGSITRSLSARYEAAPATSAGDGQATNSADRANAPGANNTSATQTPLSLAGRTAP